MAPQTSEDVAKVKTIGQVKLPLAAGVQMFSTLANNQSWTEVMTKAAMTVDRTWAMNIVRGGIFM